MNVFNEVKMNEKILENQLSEIATLSYNFNRIPPVIGIIVANKFGNTLLVLEYKNELKHNYGPIKSYLSEDDKNFLDIDLISMYFSSFKAFAGETNIQNLSNLEIHGSNIKVQIYFLFDKYMIILFLNSKVDFNLKEKTQIIRFFEEKLERYEFEFTHFNALNSRKIIRMIMDKGTLWLKHFNKHYIRTFENAFLKKHEMIDIVMDKIAPIIQKELGENLIGIPEDVINNVSTEIRNKIQDRICEFNLDFY